MRSPFRKLGLFILASMLMASVSAWAQGYPTQGSTSSPQAQSGTPAAQAPASTAPAAQDPASGTPATSVPDDSSQANAKPDKNAPSPETLKNIDAIGNRNVGCGRGAGNWYSLDKQVAMGPVSYTHLTLPTKRIV